MKKLFVAALLVSYLGVRVQAQGSPTPPKVDDQTKLKQVRDLLRVDALWNKPLDWKEKGSSTSSIVSHVQQAIGNEAYIEVRVKDTNLSTFALDQSPLGPTLTSVASLANSKLWAFPMGLVIAPEAQLTDVERGFIQNGTGGEWQNSYMAGPGRWNARQQLTQIALPIIGADLKNHLALKGVTIPAVSAAPPTSQPKTLEESRAAALAELNRPFPYELPIGELSPGTKEIVQNLFDAQASAQAQFRLMYPNMPGMAAPQGKTPIIDDSTIVGFDDTGKSQVELRVQQPDAKAPQGRQELGRWDIQKPRPPFIPTAR